MLPLARSTPAVVAATLHDTLPPDTSQVAVPLGMLATAEVGAMRPAGCGNNWKSKPPAPLAATYWMVNA